MFCGCSLSFGDEPNTHTCPVCLGHPGTLPVTNAEAVHFALMIAMAFDCEIAPRSIFHRKNYFYPDLPKGYQISQYDIPLAANGRLGDVRIHRVHMEEDAAKLIHAGSSGRIHGAETSVVDFNRGGTPLVEIVTEPDLRSPREAAEFGRLLQATLRRMGVSDVNMEEGSLRVDANVSIRPAGTATLGTKTELKNMNSFRFLERGIAAEIARQEQILRGGGEVEQETLHYDPQTGTLTSLRSKEEAHDYRYFPEPDLVPVAPTEEMLSAPARRCPSCRRRAPSGSSATSRCPPTRRACSPSAPSSATSSSRRWRPGNGDARTLANWTTNELAARIGDSDPARHGWSLRRSPSSWRWWTRSRSRPARPEVLDVLVAEGGDPAAVVEAKGLGRAESGELESIVDRAIADNPDAVEKIREGKRQAIGAIVGVVMRETKGRADGGEVQRMISERLGLWRPAATAGRSARAHRVCCRPSAGLPRP